MVTVVQNHYILVKSVLYIQKDFYYPGTRITFFSYLVIIWIVRMKYLRKIFCSLLFLWKKTQTCEYADGKNIHACICLSVCLYVSALQHCLLRDSSFVQAEGLHCQPGTNGYNQKPMPLDGYVDHCHRPVRQPPSRRFHN